MINSPTLLLCFQVARTAASANAFASGFFAPVHPQSLGGNLNSSSLRPQAVALTMAPKRSDPLLRFYDTCPTYQEHEKFTKKWIESWMSSNWTRLTPRLEERLGMTRNMDPCEVEAVWQLCLAEVR